MIWIEAMRPKTLIISIAPVVIAAVLSPILNWWVLLATLVCALAIQVGTNFANDYYDYKSDADTKKRKGPRKVIAAGLVKAEKMRSAMVIAFLIACIAGSFLIVIGGVPIMILFVLAVLAGIFYTASKYSLKRTGLADIVVFVFFGPVATLATYYLQTGTVNQLVVLASIAPGLIPVAVLTANNVRDRAEDKKHGKKTLTVRFGKRFGQMQYMLCLLVGVASCALLAPYRVWMLLPLLSLIICIPLIRTMWTYRRSQKLIGVLVGTGVVLWLYTLLFCIGAIL